MNEMKHELLTLEIESGLKSEMERVCHKLGMNISTAFSILARKFIREQKTSSGRLSEDIFYSPSNIEYLKKVTDEIAQGQQNFLSMNSYMRIDSANRIVYREKDGVIVIASCKGHYDN